jgi:hypothetical protein
MRRSLFALLAAALVAADIAASSGAAPPRKVIRSYCSSSGDLCFGVINKSGAIYFELTTAARYFSRYRLCVRPPTGSWRCGAYPMRQRGDFARSSVRFAGGFPYRGAGIYRVRWSLGGQPLGPTLRFRLPLR